MIDTQMQHATLIMIPPASPDQETWYFNKAPTRCRLRLGNVENVFTVPHLISAGH